MISEINTLLALPIVGMLVLLSLTIFTHLKTVKRRRFTLILAIGLCMSVACLLISIAVLNTSNSGSLKLLFGLLNAPNFIFFWLFIRNLFEDDFSLHPIHWCVVVSYVGLMVWERLSDHGVLAMPGIVKIIVALFSISLIVHLVWSLLRDRGNDLVEGRRRTRFHLVAVLLFAAFISVAATNGVGLISQNVAVLLSVLSIAVATITVAVYALSLDYKRLVFDQGEMTLDAKKLSGKNKINYLKLMSHIEDQDVFLDSSVTIGKLARDIGVGEHTLRALINKQLGFRNFNEFTNRNRVMIATIALSDPDKAHLPILTIALDSGFNSVSVFNRAFRNIEGMTPSEFRKGTTHT